MGHLNSGGMENFMEWNVGEIIAGPILGAVIGYVTNKIAVSMLFWPLHPIFIGKFQLPFTPGIIPKGKGRFGKAVGEAVGKTLLTPSVIKNTLLSNEVEDTLLKHLNQIFQRFNSENITIEDKILTYVTEEKKETLELEIIGFLTEKIQKGILSMDLGDIISNEVITAVKEKTSGTMLKIFLQPSIIEAIKEEIAIRINQYIINHGKEKISGVLTEEYKDFIRQTTVSSLVGKIDSDNIKSMLLEQYRMFVNKYAEKILSVLDFSKIVEAKVNDMDTKEMERLILVIMKHELGAVVKLGAFIGFILGLVNLII